MGKTSIEWADFSWNVTTGCTKLSAGCDRCYAERMARRQVTMGLARHEAGSENDATWVAYSNAIDPETGKWSGEITCRYDKLSEPLHWKKPRRIFVSSMSDLFHGDVKPQFVHQVFEVMEQASQHTFLLLTKRPKHLAWFVSTYSQWRSWPLPNVWLGVTAENQEWWEKRRAAFFDCPAALHFLSYEPALGPLVFSDDDLRRLDLVIVGGETGPGARLMELDWVTSIRDQCMEAGASLFFKGWGAWFPRSQWEDNPDLLLPDDCDCIDGPNLKIVDGEIMHRVGKKRSGRLLDGREWNEMPQIATMPL